MYLACLAKSDCFQFPFSAAPHTLLFTADIMDCFLAGDDQPQINQLNGHAGG